MPRIDWPIEELREYRPTVNEPADFDGFWAKTLSDARSIAKPPKIVQIASRITSFEIFDVRFSGYAGDQISGWLTVPAGTTGALPAIIEYNGYGAGRGLPNERLAWASAGFAYFVMDTRGQGSSGGTGGNTPDPHGTGPSVPGFMTRGIESPDTYFYRRVFTDAVLAVDAVRSFDRVDADRVSVCGGSQGGGIAIAAASLSDGLVAAMPDVPFLCHFERAVGMTDKDPYQEVVRYLSVHREAADATFATLSYFDGVNFAKRAKVPALFSVCLMDPVCPPSTVFAARNAWPVSADINVYAFNEHEGGQGLNWQRQVDWLARLGADAG